MKHSSRVWMILQNLTWQTIPTNYKTQSVVQHEWINQLVRLISCPATRSLPPQSPHNAQKPSWILIKAGYQKRAEQYSTCTTAQIRNLAALLVTNLATMTLRTISKSRKLRKMLLIRSSYQSADRQLSWLSSITGTCIVWPHASNWTKRLVICTFRTSSRQ